jgi:hypothetical protein
MNQDQDGSLEKNLDREQKAQPKRTQNERSQGVKERRESNVNDKPHQKAIM